MERRRMHVAFLLMALAVLVTPSVGSTQDPEPSTWGRIKATFGEDAAPAEPKGSIEGAYPNYCFYLNVPWMSQLPPGTNWSLTNNCGQAVCVMLGGYFNNGIVAPGIIDAENDWLHCPRPYGCTTGAGTLQYLLSGFHALRSASYIGNGPDDVVMEGARGRPVIVGVRTYMSPSGGRPHWMLFVGWDGTYMYFHDPGRSQPGNGDPATGGRFVHYTTGEFYSSWNNQGRKYIPVWK